MVQSASYHKAKVIKCIKDVLPSTTKTCIWLLKLTVGVSLAILFLRYLNILPWFSNLISPLFNYLGLPGEAALAFVTGYFVNVYAAISVAVSLELDVRMLTILSVMVLCAHNMVTETAVQKKTGSSAKRIVIIRTLSAFVLAYILNLIMPGAVTDVLGGVEQQSHSLKEMFSEWAVSTLEVVIKMTTLIYTLAIMQKLLSEYGVIMMEEVEAKKVTKKDIDLLNSHIAISHSNLEDLFLLSALGGIWYILLFSRWIGAFVLVWELRLEYFIKERYIQKK